MNHKIGRNDACPCGSGKKYKKCCGAEEPQVSNEHRDDLKNTYASSREVAERYVGPNWGGDLERDIQKCLGNPAGCTEAEIHHYIVMSLYHENTDWANMLIGAWRTNDFERRNSFIAWARLIDAKMESSRTPRQLRDAMEYALKALAVNHKNIIALKVYVEACCLLDGVDRAFEFLKTQDILHLSNADKAYLFALISLSSNDPKTDFDRFCQLAPIHVPFEYADERGTELLIKHLEVFPKLYRRIADCTDYLEGTGDGRDAILNDLEINRMWFAMLPFAPSNNGDIEAVDLNIVWDKIGATAVGMSTKRLEVMLPTFRALHQIKHYDVLVKFYKAVKPYVHSLRPEWKLNSILFMVLDSLCYEEDPDAETIRKEIESVSPIFRGNKVEDGLSPDLLGKLTPTSRQSYFLASKTFEHLRDSEGDLCDSSMVCLGFMRMIDIELNQRLVKPLAEKTDLGRLKIIIEDYNGHVNFLGVNWEAWA